MLLQHTVCGSSQAAKLRFRSIVRPTMTGFLQWYLRNLKTRPFFTNLSSGVVLMTAGDVMAQAIERHSNVPGHELAENPSVEGVPQNQRLHMRPYGRPLEEEGEHSESALYNAETWKWRESTQLVLNSIRTEVEDLDYFRTATMIGWSVGYMTPVFLYLYRLFDRMFPQKTPATICARVFGSFVVSIPTNAIFFMYGTSIHHVAEWIAVREDWREELQDFGLDQSAVDHIMDNGPPFDFEMMLAKGVLKVESELVNTISASAKAWIPINLFNFALIPSHLRPLVFMTASVFWNCYLSLVQHRDMALPSMEAAAQ